MRDTVEFKKQVPFKGSYDVAVFGGGPAGVCAAVEAARDGAKVLLVEGTGMLGGMATSGLVGPLMTSSDREGGRQIVGGIFREICERLEKKRGALLPETMDSPSIYTSFIGRYHKCVTPVDSFLLQIVLDEICRESGVEVLLYSRFAGCDCKAGGIETAYLLELQGLSAVRAGIYLDCTGNADVAEAAGVPTWKGDEETHTPQPGTLMFEVDGADDSRYTERPERPVKAYRMPSPGKYKINHYHVYSVDAANSESMSAAHAEARGQVLDALEVLHRTPGFENCALTQVAPVLGVRESRHIEGAYKLTTADLTAGTKFCDRVAAYAFGMDVHSRNPAEKGNFKIPTADVYYVPYRVMLPLNCKNLLVAGKTVSCESAAAGAIRVMPCAMALGQAAGAAAALCISHKFLPAVVSTDELQKLLLSHNAILD